MKRKKKPLTISADKIRKLGKAVRIFVTAESGSPWETMIYESWIFWRENVGKIELVSASRRLSFCFPSVSSFEMICSLYQREDGADCWENNKNSM